MTVDAHELRPRFGESWRRLFDSLGALVQNRIELLTVELREERCHLIEIVTYAAALAVFGGMALLLVSLGLIFVFWEQRVLVVAVLVVVHASVAFACYRAVISRIHAHTALSATLGELKKDREWLLPNNSRPSASEKGS